MSHKKDTIDSMRKSLTDCRSIGTIVELEDLIVRKRLDSGKTEYRITDKEGKPLTSVNDIISYLNVDTCTFTPVRVRKERYGSSLTGIRVMLNDVFVRIDRVREDSDLVMNYGVGAFRLCLVASYSGDNDTSTPIKLNYMSLSKIDRHTKLPVPDHLKRHAGVIIEDED